MGVKNFSVDLKNVYNKIAKSWSELKIKPFSFFTDFVTGKKGLFFVEGCGAARHSSLVSPVVGVDFSFEMIKIAKKKDPNGLYLVCDVRALPFKTGVFDYGVSVAVLHHLPPRACLVALKELRRVTKRECLVSVWRHPKLVGESFVKFGKFERYYYFYSRDEFINLVSKVFSNIKEVPYSENLVFVSNV